MRRMLIPVVGAACLGLAGLAVAQPAPPAGPGGPPAAGTEAPPAPPARGPGGPEGRPGPGGRMMMMGPHHPPHGASFRLRRGNDSITIRCSERESMQACVNAASALLDKMSSTLR